jgi:hypothetical protein
MHACEGNILEQASALLFQKVAGDGGMCCCTAVRAVFFVFLPFFLKDSLK